MDKDNKEIKEESKKKSFSASGKESYLHVDDNIYADEDTKPKGHKIKTRHDNGLMAIYPAILLFVLIGAVLFVYKGQLFNNDEQTDNPNGIEVDWFPEKDVDIIDSFNGVYKNDACIVSLRSFEANSIKYVIECDNLKYVGDASIKDNVALDDINKIEFIITDTDIELNSGNPNIINGLYKYYGDFSEDDYYLKLK